MTLHMSVRGRVTEAHGIAALLQGHHISRSHSYLEDISVAGLARNVDIGLEDVAGRTVGCGTELYAVTCRRTGYGYELKYKTVTFGIIHNGKA